MAPTTTNSARRRTTSGAQGGERQVRRPAAAVKDARRSAFGGPVEILGGSKMLAQNIENSLDAHELLKQGLPAGALHHMVENVALLRDSHNFTVALGMSPRTRQRKRNDETERLNREQSGRAWKFAEVLAKATDVFGSQEGAEQWLTKPATALDRRTPLELLDTAAGLDLVETLLTRLDYGVYT